VTATWKGPSRTVAQKLVISWQLSELALVLAVNSGKALQAVEVIEVNVGRQRKKKPGGTYK